jgi:Phosphotransferase enzyme family
MTAQTNATEALDPSWLAAIGEWIEDRLLPRGLTISGDLEPVHIRPWSTVIKVPTATGDVWFKANGGATRYEPRLMVALSRWTTGRVLTPLAIDAERGWSLLPDGGPTLRSAGADLAEWTEMLRQYGELQRETVPLADDLMAMGVPDQRPSTMPSLLAGLLSRPDDLRIGEADGLSAQTYARLQSSLPEFTEWCAELEAAGVPAMVQHDDLHDANVFVDGERLIFFDWGDASVSHPFCSLLVTLNAASRRFELAPGDPALLRLRDSYLEPWTEHHDREDLIRAVSLAVKVGTVGRAVAWRRALTGSGAPAWRDYGEAVPGWLAELFEPQAV